MVVSALVEKTNIIYHLGDAAGSDAVLGRRGYTLIVNLYRGFGRSA